MPKRLKEEWERLLSTKRLGTSKVDAIQRDPFEVDQDVIIFSQPFRRLKDKTQVYPLAENDHVRTRLSHSLEVSSVGQALGSIIGRHFKKNLNGSRATHKVSELLLKSKTTEMKEDSD